MQNVVIAGVGIHPFGRFDYGYRELGEYAARACLADAGIRPEELDHVFVANVGAERFGNRLSRLGHLFRMSETNDDAVRLTIDRLSHLAQRLLIDDETSEFRSVALDRASGLGGSG